MGCHMSRPPIPEPTPEPTPEPEQESEEEEVTDSDFILFLSESADIDEVKVEKNLTSYPKAVPIQDTKKLNRGAGIRWFESWTAQIDDDVSDTVDIYSDSDDVDLPVIRTQQDVDKHARKAPASLNSSFDDLLSYLTSNLENSDRPDVFRARAILVWLSMQDVDSRAVEEGQGDRETPGGYLTLLAQRKSTYSTFFLVLCRKANIQCSQIEGVCKAGDYQPGDDDVERHGCVWNAIFVENSWHIVHPFWVCRCLVGQSAGGWIKLEAGGQIIGKKEQDALGIMKNAFEEYYFMTNPNEFIYMCHPSDPEWQLRSTTISRRQFREQSYLQPTFFGLGLVMKSNDACVYPTVDGVVQIKLEAPAKNANAIDMWYEFLLKEGSGERSLEKQILLAPESMSRFVAMIRLGERWLFRVYFPMEGTYKLRLYGGPNKTTLLHLAEFRLDCSSSRKECVPLPIDPGVVGFGPGPTADKAGLIFASHRDGIYPITKRNPIVLTFHLEEDILHTVDVRTSLVSSRSENGRFVSHEVDASVHHDVSRKKRQLYITVAVTENGEYALSISVLSSPSTQKYENVCNYLLSTNILSRREAAPVRIAKNKLREALKMDTDSPRYDEETARDIQEALAKCQKARVPDDDEEVESAKIRLDYLFYKKEIHDANLRQNWHVTEKTVRRLLQSRFAHTFRIRIDNLVSQRDRQARQLEEHRQTYRRDRRNNIVTG